MDNEWYWFEIRKTDTKQIINITNTATSSQKINNKLHEALTQLQYQHGQIHWTIHRVCVFIYKHKWHPECVHKLLLALLLLIAHVTRPNKMKNEKKNKQQLSKSLFDYVLLKPNQRHVDMDAMAYHTQMKHCLPLCRAYSSLDLLNVHKIRNIHI